MVMKDLFVYSIAIDSIVDYPIGMERFFGWDAKAKKVSLFFTAIFFSMILCCMYCKQLKIGGTKVVK